MSYAQLIVDTIEPKEEDMMYLLPSKLSTSKYLASNIFDEAIIRNCPVEKITSSGLIGIFSSLKPLGKINIIVFQPITVMLFYDSKQIEANLKLAGFEDIKISDVNIKDEKTGKTIQTQQVEAIKPESKRNVDINIEIKKTQVKEISKNEPPSKGSRFTSTTTKTTTTTTETINDRPRNKTYVRQEVKEVLPQEDKKTFSRKGYGQNVENNEPVRPKNRTYVRGEKNNETTNGYGGYKRRTRYTNSNN